MVKDSLEVIAQLKSINFNQQNIWLVTSDAINMYPNISNDEGIMACNNYFDLYAHACKCFSPKELLVKLLNIIMNKNVFKFGNTWWVQKDGTTMGTPSACNYATIVFAYSERTNILPTFKNNFLLYIRFIDDIFIVWKDSPTTPNVFDSFKKSLNDQCKLKWKTVDKSTKLDFLDITIKLDQLNGTFVTCTFQKESNIHLHIPGNSAHPPGVVKSIIFGR